MAISVKGALLRAKNRMSRARLGGGGDKVNAYDTFTGTGFELSQRIKMPLKETPVEPVVET
jgi:hypothetical protein